MGGCWVVGLLGCRLALASVTGINGDCDATTPWRGSTEIETRLGSYRTRQRLSGLSKSHRQGAAEAKRCAVRFNVILAGARALKSCSFLQKCTARVLAGDRYDLRKDLSQNEKAVLL